MMTVAGGALTVALTYLLGRGMFGRIAGLRVAIVGDILHSRVARSNLWGLMLMGANVVLCGPPTMLPAPDFCDGLDFMLSLE